MKLIIAEKPSLAKAIAEGLGGARRGAVWEARGYTITNAFGHLLKDNRDYHPLSQAAEARARADWLVGMNLTRAWTIANHGLLSVGRARADTDVGFGGASRSRDRAVQAAGLL